MQVTRCGNGKAPQNHFKSPSYFNATRIQFDFSTATYFYIAFI